MTTEFINRILTGDLLIEASITFFVFSLGWFVSFAFGLALLKLKIGFIRLAAYSVIIAILSLFKCYFSSFYIILMIIPVFAMFIFIARGNITFSRRNITTIFLVSALTIFASAIGEIIFGGGLLFILGKKGLTEFLARKAGFYGLILFSLFEMLIPGVFTAVKIKFNIKDMPIFKETEFDGPAGTLIFITSYFIISTFIMEFVVSLKNGMLFKDLIVYQLISVFVAFVLRHRKAKQMKVNYESQIHILQDEIESMSEEEELSPEIKSKLDEANMYLASAIDIVANLPRKRYVMKKNKLAIVSKNPAL